ncbi:MAG: response regulator [Candidatus Aenigmatarchaeota archaeon]
MKKILVVDDEEYIRVLYKEELEDEGYNVCVACDGEEALRKIEEERPDLVILDIKMPGINGIEVLRKLRQRWRDLPVILSTAYGEYKRDFSTWASDAYEVKSSDLTSLKKKVKDLIGKD